MGKINHEKRNRRPSRDDKTSEIESRIVVETVVLEGQSEADIQWMQAMLRQDGFSAQHKQRMRETLAWLEGCPRRTIGRGWRKFYTSISRLLRQGKYGEPYEPSGEQRQKKVSACKLRRIRNQERKPKMPEWMTDPSKLPKTPPRSA